MMPASSHRWLLLIILFVAGITVYRLKAPELSTPLKNTQLESAYGMLQEITKSHRAPGSKGHAQTQKYLFQKLNEFGCEARFQKSQEFIENRDQQFIAGYAENILCRLKGSDGERAILIMSHYDTVPHSPGASENGSSVSASLELLRSLNGKNPYKNDLIFLFSDLEEIGFIGALAFAQRHPWMKDIELIINLVSRGNSGPVSMFETIGTNEYLIKSFSKSTSQPIGNSIIPYLYRFLPNNTELTVFKDHNKNGFNFAFADGLNAHHSASDTSNFLDKRSLKHMLLYLEEVVDHFGNLDLRTLQGSSRLIYFDFWRFKLLYFPLWSTYFVLLLSFFVFIFLKKQNRWRWLELIQGSLLFLIKIVLVTTAFIVISQLINVLLHPQFVYAQYRKIFLAYCLLFLPLFCKDWIYPDSKIYNRSNRLFFWFLIGILLTIKFPDLSYVINYSLFFVLCFEVLLTRKVLNKTTALILGSLFFFPMAIILPYNLYSLLIMDSGKMPLFSFLSFLLFVNLSSSIWSSFPKESQRLSLTVSWVTGLALLFLVFSTREYTEQNPQKTHLNYVWNSSEKKAFWIHWGQNPEKSEWIQKLFPKENYEILEEYGNISPVKGFPLSKAKAPRLSYTPAPKIEKIYDKRGRAKDLRSIKLLLSSPRKAPCLKVWTQRDVHIQETLLNGEEAFSLTKEKSIPKFLDSKWKNSDGTHWSLEYCGSHKKALSIVIKTNEKGRIPIQISDHTWSLPNFHSIDLKRKSNTWAPKKNGDQTMITRSYKL